MRTVDTCLLASVLFLAACGGSPPSSPSAQGKNAGFSDPQMQALWVQAQTAIATQQFDLNAALVAEGRDVPHDWRAPDSRALNISPAGITVTRVPDIPLSQLQRENPGLALNCKADPCGIIRAPEGASSRYARAYMLDSSVVVPASLTGALYDEAVTWEFANEILARLGYNISGR